MLPELKDLTALCLRSFTYWSIVYRAAFCYVKLTKAVSDLPSYCNVMDFFRFNLFRQRLKQHALAASQVDRRAQFDQINILIQARRRSARHEF